MKKLVLFTILISLFTLSTIKGQEINYNYRIDSLINSMKIQQSEIEHIKLNLNKCHKEFQTGTTLYVLGFMVTGMYLITDISALPYISGGCFLIGSICMIDSHKFISVDDLLVKKNKPRHIVFEDLN